MRVRDILLNLRGMTFQDVVKNIRWSKVGLSVAWNDPWDRRIIEEELKKRNIEYLFGYNPIAPSYECAVLGGDRQKIHDFVKWFKAERPDWVYFMEKNPLTNCQITCLVWK